MAAIVLIGALLWFLPEICTLSVDTTPVAVTFMKQYTLWTWSAWVSKIVAFFAALALAVWTSMIIKQQQVVGAGTSMPLFFIVALWAVSDSAQLFDERYPAMALFILMWRQTLLLYRQNQQVGVSFNTILCIGAASFFEPYFMWLALVFFLGLAVYRTVTQRVFLGVFWAVVTLLSLSFSLFWLFDNAGALTNGVIMALDWHFGDILEQMSLPTIIAGGFMTLLLLIVAAFNVFTALSGNHNLRVRQNYSLTNSILVMTVLWVLCFSSDTDCLPMVPLLFAAVNFALYFSSAKGKTADILFYITLAAMLFYRLTAIPVIENLIIENICLK